MNERKLRRMEWLFDRLLERVANQIKPRELTRDEVLVMKLVFYTTWEMARS